MRAGWGTGPFTQAVCSVRMLCALVKEMLLSSFFWGGGSNSPELNQPASDVLCSAIMRDFPRGSRGKAKKLKLGLVDSDGS